MVIFRKIPFGIRFFCMPSNVHIHKYAKITSYMGTTYYLLWTLPYFVCRFGRSAERIRCANPSSHSNVIRVCVYVTWSIQKRAHARSFTQRRMRPTLRARTNHVLVAVCGSAQCPRLSSNSKISLFRGIILGWRARCCSQAVNTCAGWFCLLCVVGRQRCGGKYNLYIYFCILSHYMRMRMAYIRICVHGDPSWANSERIAQSAAGSVRLNW